MDILKDIRDILVRNKDKERMLKIVVDWSGVTVYLDYDPEKDFEEKCVLPIRYDTLDGFAYIPDSEYREKFHPNDFGIEYEDIVLIKEIMEYLESHSKEINDLCVGYDWEDRKIINEESEEIEGEKPNDR